MFCDVPGLPSPNGAALPLQRGGLCEAHRMNDADDTDDDAHDDKDDDGR